MGPFQPRVFYGSVILSMLKLCISYKDLKERHLEIIEFLKDACRGKSWNRKNRCNCKKSRFLIFIMKLFDTEQPGHNSKT